MLKNEKNRKISLTKSYLLNWLLAVSLRWGSLLVDGTFLALIRELSLGGHYCTSYVFSFMLSLCCVCVQLHVHVTYVPKATYFYAFFHHFLY